VGEGGAGEKNAYISWHWQTLIIVVLAERREDEEKKRKTGVDKKKGGPLKSGRIIGGPGSGSCITRRGTGIEGK